MTEQVREERGMRRLYATALELVEVLVHGIPASDE